MGNGMLINLFDRDLGAAEVEEITLALRRELLEIPEVERVGAVESGPAPAGSRAVGLIELGSLVVALQPTVEAIGKVIRVAYAWFRRRGTSDAPHGVLRITINGQSLELTPTDDQQDQLVEEYVRAAVAAGGSAAPPGGSSGLP